MRLRLFDQGHDLVVRRRREIPHDRELHRSSDVYRAASYLSSLRGSDRLGLSCKVCHIKHGTLWRQYRPIERHDLAALDQDHVAFAHVLDGNLVVGRSCFDEAGLWDSVSKLGKSGLCSSGREGFERLAAAEHERDHRAGDVTAVKEREGHRSECDVVETVSSCADMAEGLVRDLADADHDGRGQHIRNSEEPDNKQDKDYCRKKEH